eukprot:TRINITY_DN31546_c0_g1_i1.p1 TRINITY_DN31546_c0_g1~~TRINITY_DN31546_c0_g1_i1.p1  ORF type:complete len:317 (+),score=32.89 TRINITY_DN31546_c0_g1_i1:58-1008(+)
MALTPQLAFATLGSVAAYTLWHKLVVKKAARAVGEVGPRSLAVWLSRFPFAFGDWMLKFTFNGDEMIASGRVDPRRQYMIVWHPHGVFTINSLFFFTHLSAKAAILGKPLFCGVADFLFKVPGLAEFLVLCNAKDVGNKTMEELLAGGYNVGVNPGGMHEQVNTDHCKETVSFPGQLGFIRLAIKHGVPLLPCYNFGENQLFHTSEPVRRINRWMYKKFQVGNFLVHGRGGILQTPFLMNPLILPEAGRHLHCRVGEPVEVGPADPNPSDEKVKEVFLRYCAGLQKLFDEHKESCLIEGVAATGLEFHVRAVRSRL